MANSATHLYTARTNGGGNAYSPPRVVITGIGALTPLGLNIPDTWDALLVGTSGIATVTKFDTSELRTTFGGELKGFDPLNYLDRKEARRLDPYIQYAMVATQQAIADAAIDLTADEPHLIGVVIASGIGGIQSLVENVELVHEKGLRRISPFLVPNMLVDSAAGRIAIEYGLHGPNFAVVNACASGTAATGEAFELIRRGDADVMIVGGAEAGLMPITMAGFDVMGALSQRNDDPAAACRPFDADRDGFVMSEGAAVMVMESLEHALARGARIYAEVIGYGNSADAYHMAAPHTEGRGARDAMRMALRKAAAYGVQPYNVDYINAHGTSTQLNDPGETLAIKQVLGEHAYTTRISSTKSMLGHMLGAAGAIEAIICAKTIETGMIPPTINLCTPDPACDLNYTPNVAVQADVRVTLSNSFGFGGHNACVMLRKYEGEAL
ncbi:MAG: beta-ketoacyl-[acyl-carrier-protein] synthase II [Chloroflexi bacterium]|nr:MAG: beta-ketoacyl-[acyl-carrier-protein] synthase II [Chloroflexota bacterium]